MNRTLLTLSFTAVLLGAPQAGSAQDVQAIVDQFYPSRLMPLADDFKHSCYSVLRTMTNGEPDIIAAAYTDTASAVLRLLSRTGPSSYVMVYESPTSISMTGMTCEVFNPDLDGDGQPDVFLTLSFEKGSSNWVFRWTGSSLVNVTPTYTEGQRERSQLLGAGVFDLYHDGTLQVVASGESNYDEVNGFVLKTPNRSFRLGTTYQPDAWFVKVTSFRAGQDPRAYVRPFVPVVDSIGPYTIRIVNGDRLGQKRVTGGSLSLNGVQIVAPGELTDQVEYLTRTVSSLSPDNELTAAITGPADAQLVVTVTDSRVRP